jgi:hypothetical protein
VKRHDGNSTMVVTQFDVATPLADPNESHLGQSSDYFYSRADRKSRTHAVRRKVAMIGGSKP